MGWRDTGVVISPEHFTNNHVCFDATQPNVILITDVTKNTTAYNWVTGERTVVKVNTLPYRFCGGIGFPLSSSYILSNAGFFCLADPNRCEEQVNRPESKIAVSDADPNIVYTVSVSGCDYNNHTRAGYTVYFSNDGGVTREKRYEGGAECIATISGPLPYVDVWTIPNAPVNVVLLTIHGTVGHSDTNYFVSSDEARTFQRIGISNLSTSTQVVHTHEGILRMLRYHTYGENQPRLSLSTDGGRNWNTLAGPPFNLESSLAYAESALGVSRIVPTNVFLQADQLWHSADGGHTWKQYENYKRPFNIQVTPYLPMTILSIKDNRLYTLDLPDAGKDLRLPSVPNGVQDGTYFPQTGHNLLGAFKAYWEAHGGLP